MKMLKLALLASPFVLSIACASDDNSDAHGGLAGFAGQPAAAGSGGQNEAETGGQPDAGAENTPDIGAHARQALCERICATQAQLPCPPDSVECVQGWCPVGFPPSCQSQFDLMLDCMADEPVTSFECIDTEARPLDTACVDEQTALGTCIQGLQE